MVLEAAGEKLATVALRPHLVWGPGDSHIIPGLLRRARKGQLRRLGRREKEVDFTYIDMPYTLICWRPNGWLLITHQRDELLDYGRSARAAVGIHPIGCWKRAGLPPVTKSVHPGLAYAAAWVVELLYRGLGVRSEPRLTRFLIEEMATAHWFDISAARRDLGYRPLVDVETGMEG